MLNDILVVLSIQLFYVPVLTLRTIFLVKGITHLATLFSFIECLVYVFGLSIIFNGEKNPVILVVYSFGFAIGIFLGGYIEKKLSIGYIYLTANLINNNTVLIDTLRASGFGVNVLEVSGTDSLKYKLEILTKRIHEEELIRTIQYYEPKAFIISFEPRNFKSGHLVKSMKNTI